MSDEVVIPFTVFQDLKNEVKELKEAVSSLKADLQEALEDVEYWKDEAEGCENIIKYDMIDASECEFITTRFKSTLQEVLIDTLSKGYTPNLDRNLYIQAKDLVERAYREVERKL